MLLVARFVALELLPLVAAVFGCYQVGRQAGRRAGR
jgi:hypothetical protein